MNIEARNYPDFLAVIADFRGVGSVFYWDDTAGSSAFRAYASVDGGRSGVSVILATATPPATFATDFPNAVQLTDSLAIFN